MTRLRIDDADQLARWVHLVEQDQAFPHDVLEERPVQPWELKTNRCYFTPRYNPQNRKRPKLVLQYVRAGWPSLRVDPKRVDRLFERQWPKPRFFPDNPRWERDVAPTFRKYRRLSDLNEDQRREIGHLYYDAKEPVRNIAKQFNLSTNSVYNLLQEIAWRENYPVQGLPGSRTYPRESTSTADRLDFLGRMPCVLCKAECTTWLPPNNSPAFFQNWKRGHCNQCGSDWYVGVTEFNSLTIAVPQEIPGRFSVIELGLLGHRRIVGSLAVPGFNRPQENCK